MTPHHASPRTTRFVSRYTDRLPERLRALSLGVIAFAVITVAVIAVAAIIAAQPADAQSKPPPATRTAVDLELILAVDISMSMDPEEQTLQRQGYVEAFRDPALHAAIASGTHQRIAVTYFEWAGQLIARTLVPWTLIDTPQAANDFAARLEGHPISRQRMTSISGAMRYATEEFRANPFQAPRRVLDISGDGPNNNGPPVTTERDRLVAAGVVINGLPIVLKRRSSSFDIAELEDYYRGCVTGGEGAFVIPITAPPEFITATRLKLLREIASLPAPHTAPDQAPHLIRTTFWSTASKPPDCMVGEKMWQRYMDGYYER